jgi:ureidoglycolate lyase
MVVVGKKPIDFVVVQFANDVDIEDCQEAKLNTNEGGRLCIALPAMTKKELSKL